MDIILLLIIISIMPALILNDYFTKPKEIICILILIICLCIYGLTFNQEIISYTTSDKLIINTREIQFNNPVKIKIIKTTKRFGSSMLDNYKYEIIN